MRPEAGIRERESHGKVLGATSLPLEMAEAASPGMWAAPRKPKGRETVSSRVSRKNAAPPPSSFGASDPQNCKIVTSVWS